MNTLLTWDSTVRREMTSWVADRVVGVALGHQAKDLALPFGQRVERVPFPAAAQQLADDLGIDDALADAHPAQRVADRGPSLNAVLEQVAAVGRMLAEQGLSVADFQVAGQPRRSASRRLRGLADRIEVAGGTLAVVSPAGGPIRVGAEVPLPR